MSSIPNHGLQGVIVASALTFIFASIFSLAMTNPIILLMVLCLGAVGAYYSTLPDVYGYAGGSASGKWDLYNNAHNQSPTNNKVYHKYVDNPLYFLHVWQDIFTHKPGHRWWILKEGLWLEILMDLVWLFILSLTFGWWILLVVGASFLGAFGLALTIVSEVHNGKIPEALP